MVKALGFEIHHCSTIVFNRTGFSAETVAASSRACRRPERLASDARHPFLRRQSDRHNRHQRGDRRHPQVQRPRGAHAAAGAAVCSRLQTFLAPATPPHMLWLDLHAGLARDGLHSAPRLREARRADRSSRAGGRTGRRSTTVVRRQIDSSKASTVKCTFRKTRSPNYGLRTVGPRLKTPEVTATRRIAIRVSSILSSVHAIPAAASGALR